MYYRYPLFYALFSFIFYLGKVQQCRNWHFGIPKFSKKIEEGKSTGSDILEMGAVLLATQVLLVLILRINGVDLNSTIRLIQLGDWGGDQNGSDGYATPAQVFMDSLTH